jgi:hypothetical protein
MKWVPKKGEHWLSRVWSFFPNFTRFRRFYGTPGNMSGNNSDKLKLKNPKDGKMIEFFSKRNHLYYYVKFRTEEGEQKIVIFGFTSKKFENTVLFDKVIELEKEELGLIPLVEKKEGNSYVTDYGIALNVGERIEDYISDGTSVGWKGQIITKEDAVLKFIEKIKEREGIVFYYRNKWGGLEKKMMGKGELERMGFFKVESYKEFVSNKETFKPRIDD